MKVVENRAAFVARLRLALGVGAGVWLFLIVASLTTAAEWVPALADSLRAPQSYIVAGWLAALVVSPLIACGDPFRYRPMCNVYLAAMLLVIVGLFALKMQGTVPSILDRSIPIATTLASGLVLWAYWGGD